MHQIADFELQTVNDAYFDKAELQGKWTLIFFGYTYCPDVCPQTLRELKLMLQALDEEGKSNDIQIVFVSVDPMRDTLERIKQYVKYFDQRFIGVTAQMQVLQSFSEIIGVKYFTIESADDADFYLMSHSAEIFVFNPSGERFAIIPPPYDSLEMRSDLNIFREVYAARE